MSLLEPTARRVVLAASFVAASLAAATWSTRAEADLPSPPGIRRVSYSFKVSGEIPAALRLVAYPAYIDGSSTPELAVGREYPLQQGYQPALYAVAATRLGDFPRDYKEAEAWLATNARVCLEKVPRVFSLKEEGEVLRVKDELHIESMSEAGCKVVPVATTYERSEGKELRGAFSEGRRVPPPEIASAFDDAPSTRSAPPASQGTSGAPPASPPEPNPPAASPTGSATPAGSTTAAGSSVGVGCSCLVGARGDASGAPIALAMALAAAVARRSRRHA